MPTDLEPTDVGSTAPAAAADRRRPTAVALGWRAALVVVAAVVSALQVSAWVAAPLAFAALAVTAEWPSRLRGRGPIDAALVLVAGPVVVLGLIGLLLNYLPGGLTATSWAIAAGVAELVTVVVTGLRPLPGSAVLRGLRSIRPGSWAWYGGALAVVVAAVVLSVRSMADVDVAPLEFSATETSAAHATVLMSSETALTALQIVVSSGGTDTVVARNVNIDRDHSAQLTIDIAPGERNVVTLRSADGTVLRTLILDSRPFSTTAFTGGGS
jgi:hypothetical protein